MFKLDSPLAGFLNKITDIMILGSLIIITCIPIITAGAAFTAAYYISFKMVKNEEAYIVRGFFKAFKENFKQSLILWIFVLVLLGAIAADYYIILYSGASFGMWARIVMLMATMFAAIGTAFVFPVQARFQNTVKGTIKNAFLMSMLHFPAAIIVMLIGALPFIITYIVPQLLPIIFLVGFGGVFYLQSFVFLRVFKKYEPQEAGGKEE